VSSAEKATGIGSHFASSLELTPATEFVPPANDAQPTLFDDGLAAPAGVSAAMPATEISNKLKSPSLTAPQLDSGAAINLHCPSPFPSGF
jgi:hypothetical protein